ncbi:MAG: hypothetical protein NVS3B12_29920 [Acidimicrobiales bacterium]
MNSIDVDTYIEFLAKEYLADFVGAGGAAVKFCIGDETTRARLRKRLASAAADEGYLHVAVDAAATRVHMVDQLLFAITRTLDFDELAAALATSAYRAAGFPTIAAVGLAVEAVAREHAVDATELHRSVRRRLEAEILGDAQWPRDLRLAMFRLTQHHLRTGDVDDIEHRSVLDWLTGDLRRIGALRSSLIYSRITRASAHHLLVGLPRLLVRTGHAGLVLDIDVSRLAVERRPPAELQEGVYYSKAAVLDAYEVLRQLVDATDELTSTLVVVTAGPEMVADEVRGLVAYTALQLRLADEVRDRNRVNPFASLVRLEAR